MSEKSREVKLNLGIHGWTRLLLPLAPHQAPAGRAGLTTHPSPTFSLSAVLRSDALHHGIAMGLGLPSSALPHSSTVGWDWPAQQPSIRTITYCFVFKLVLYLFEADLLPSLPHPLPVLQGFLGEVSAFSTWIKGVILSYSSFKNRGNLLFIHHFHFSQFLFFL